MVDRARDGEANDQLLTALRRCRMKGLGYLISTISVVLLGIVAWPGPSEPRWKAMAVIAGMSLSVVGMVVRYLSHGKDRREMRRAKHMS